MEDLTFGCAFKEGMRNVLAVENSGWNTLRN